nr:hypothetical protein [Haloarcula sp. CK38]
MITVVGDAVALPQEVVDLSWCPRLAFLKESEEFLELLRRELRGATAREARSKSIDIRIIPIGEPPIASITGDANTSSGYLRRITEIEVLHETEPPDETRLIRFLGVY